MCTKSFEQKNRKSEASLNYIARSCVNTGCVWRGGGGQEPYQYSAEIKQATRGRCELRASIFDGRSTSCGKCEECGPVCSVHAINVPICGVHAIDVPICSAHVVLCKCKTYSSHCEKVMKP